MLLVLTPSEVAFPSDLKIRSVPKRHLSLGRCVYPRSVFSGLFWRTVFEKPLTRYTLALAIFPIALIFKPEWALAISLAPVPMFAIVLFLETYFLSVSSPEARRGLIDPAAAQRGLDLLKVRAEQILTKIATRRNLTEGTLHLVVEQSGLLRIPPLTYVSVQIDRPDPAILHLTEDEQRLIGEALFDEAFDERTLRLINVAQNHDLHVVALDPRSISAHARLAALADAPAS